MVFIILNFVLLLQIINYFSRVFFIRLKLSELKLALMFCILYFLYFLSQSRHFKYSSEYNFLEIQNITSEPNPTNTQNKFCPNVSGAHLKYLPPPYMINYYTIINPTII
jgi:hypothetical protein